MASSSSSARVSIPKSFRSTIRNIKEIAGNHSDEDVYAMLKECSMDPNETAQKLLLQDTFHEVKKKRDKKKENETELAKTRRKPAFQGRGGRRGGGNYSSRYMSHDSGGRIIGKENGLPKGTDKGTAASSLLSNITKILSPNPTANSVVGLANGPTKEDNLNSSEVSISEVTLEGGTGTVSVIESSITEKNKTGMPPIGSVDVVRSEIGSQRSAVEATVEKGKLQGKSHGLDGNQLSEVPEVSGSAGSRPSSNYGNRSQQQIGSQRVGLAMEWKSKTVNVKPAQSSGTVKASDVELNQAEADTGSIPGSSSLALEGSATKLQRQLEEIQVSNSKQVIIPSHLQVPESERTGLNFGSFDANFGLSQSLVNDAESDKSSAQLSESSEIVENVEKPISRVENASTSPEADFAHQFQSAPQMPEVMPPRVPHSSSGIPATLKYDQVKPETTVAQEVAQYSVVHTVPSYPNFGLVPQLLGNQYVKLEGAEPQASDASRIPSFVVQQPFDPSTNYYGQVYRPTADGDGRFSPLFALTGIKHNGNTDLPSQTGQSAQEIATSLTLSSVGPASLVTQPPGVTQTSLAVGQQSAPVFRQPTFLANYLPVTQYISPFYGHPSTMHPFLSNAAFPQQPPTGSIYPASGAATGAAPVKYAAPQYKLATSDGNQSHVGVPVGYGPQIPVDVTSGNSSGSENRAPTQYKENNVYTPGQQGDGSFQPTSIYNLPQGQHITFPGMYHHQLQTVQLGPVHNFIQRSQATEGPTEAAGPPAGGVYQQQQRTWVNY